MLAVVVGTFAASSFFVRAVHSTRMPAPRTNEDQIVRVYFDQDVSKGKLPDGSFIDGKRDGFGIFERWVLRLGYFLKRPEPGESLSAADLLVVTYPREQPSDEYIERLEQYVHDGGKLLVIDSAENGSDADSSRSTANALLEPFGISLDEESSVSGGLTSDFLPGGACREGNHRQRRRPVCRHRRKNSGRLDAPRRRRGLRGRFRHTVQRPQHGRDRRYHAR